MNSAADLARYAEENDVDLASPVAVAAARERTYEEAHKHSSDDPEP